MWTELVLEATNLKIVLFVFISDEVVSIFNMVRCVKTFIGSCVQIGCALHQLSCLKLREVLSDRVRALGDLELQHAVERFGFFKAKVRVLRRQ